jgi:tripeptide aminopeptidase
MRKSIRTLALALALAATNTPAPGQINAQYLDEVRALQNRPEVIRAFDYIDSHREEILEEWIEITEINAPSGQEKERARFIYKLLQDLKLKDIHYDSIGNLIAVRKGTGGGPRVVIDAHLDTVFQPGLKIKPTIRDGKIYAPGVGDDTRNIEAMLASIRALNRARIQTKGDLIFVFTVDEERGLAGATHYVKENKGKFDYYVALDGGYEGFTYGGIGINWYRHHFIGPGGHTRSRTPPYSATLPLARAISRIYELTVPTDPPSQLNIGMLGGSEVVNAKAADAWFTVDLRSTSNEVIADLEKKVAAILDEEATRAGMTVKTEVISAAPAALIPGHRNSPLVLLAEAVHLAMGFANPPITETGSNNSSAALREGIPSISTGAGPCGDAHALTEWCAIEPFYKGVKKVILLELALAQISDR